ncbi:MAG TPA: ion channel [Rhodocyclaceae bacterium]|nr:ion channel [Rhodocyclaceae bacterium]
MARAPRIGTVLRHMGRWQDPYHLVLSLTWLQFFGVLVLAFVLVNLVFGTLYWVFPDSVANARPGAYMDRFFFSVETLATVGYGVMAPATLAGHIVASVEILTGMVGIALTTGLVFARFSRPTARILFSRRAVIRDFDGRRVLMLRMANERRNRIVEATATLTLVRSEISIDGEAIVGLHDLPLSRDRNPVFTLTWTLIHVIGDTSPLHGLDHARLTADRSRLVVSVTGHDETVAATVFTGNEYGAADVVFGGRFADILHMTPEGDRVVDMTRFHEIDEGLSS